MSQERIIRVNKSENYAMIRNEVLTDKRLSWEARGVLAYLLSKPNHWIVRNADLLAAGNAGRKKMRRILQELKDAGYMHRERERQPDGTFAWVTIIHEGAYSNPHHTPDMGGDEQAAPRGPKRAHGDAKNDSTMGPSAAGGKRAHIVNTESVNTDMEGANAPSRAKARRRRGDPVLMELSKYFVQVTGIPWLDPQTRAEWKAARSIWNAPLEKILDMVNGNLDDAKALVCQAVKRLRKNGMTIASPGSIEKTCRAIVGEVESGVFKPELSVDEMVDLVYQKMDE